MAALHDWSFFLFVEIVNVEEFPHFKALLLMFFSNYFCQGGYVFIAVS